MNDAARRAQALRQRFRMKAACNLELILTYQGLRVVSFPFAEGFEGLIYKRVIGISDRVKDRASQRIITAHELAHDLLHAGNHICNSLMDPVTRSQHEHEADVFAGQLLLPANELVLLLQKQYSVPDLAEHFDVPEWYVSTRLTQLQNDYPKRCHDFQ